MATKKTANNTSTFGLEKNLAGALCYSVGWITGVIFLLSEKKDSFVRFHAMQSVITFGFFTLLVMIPILNILLAPFVGILSFVLWLVCMLKAYQGDKFHLPVAGDLAEKQLKKLG